jgi:hypothetical protein
MKKEELFGSEKKLAEQVMMEKMKDVEAMPGLGIEFDPAEAEALGAFEELAVEEEDVRQSAEDPDEGV